MAKWNHALRIEEQLGSQARFAGSGVFRSHTGLTGFSLASKAASARCP